ncbi:MAG: hypothetical protein FJ213_07145 [Ignavibacteria bacterium]|nr:hypothetical protein [Ignavibacteria bacterium]
MRTGLKVFLILLILYPFSFISAQPSDVISSVSSENVYANQPAKIIAQLYQSANVSQIILYYKSFGSSEYLTSEMMIVGNSASSTISGENVSLPFVEYYFRILMRDGTEQVHPAGAPINANPFQLLVQEKYDPMQYEEIIFLTPLAGEKISPTGFLLSVSIYRASLAVDRPATKIFIDETDITNKVLITDDIILLPPENLTTELQLGKHVVKVVLFDTTGAEYYSSSLTFEVVSPEFADEMQKKDYGYRVSLAGESRHENLKTANYSFNRLTANLSGNYGSYYSSLLLYVTSEEKNYLQPQNRFLATIGSNWIKLSYGDNYPKFPSLIMDGKRLRGFSGDLMLGAFNLQASYGEINRAIEGKLIQTYSRSDARLGTNIIEIDSAKHGQPFGHVTLATFKRQLFAVRPYFGSGESFQLGFSYLHSKDDMNSVEFGARPKENVVVGTDLFIGFDEQRMALRGQAALSLMNNDISTGNLSDKLIDSLFGEGKSFGGDPDQIKTLRDIAGKFITVNQFISPLNPLELPTLAAEGTFSMNYIGNYFRATYLYRGNEFMSFGQNFTRNDVQGFNIYDRLGIIQNRVFISVGYERLNDNLQNQKITTTTFENIDASLSLFLRIDFPNITIGYSKYSAVNDLSKTDPDSIKRLSYIDDITNRISFTSSYDFVWGIRHRAMLSVLTSQREDNSYINTDAAYTSVILNLQSQWDNKLTTFFNPSINLSNISNKDFNYYSISIGGRYRLLDDKLELTGILIPTFGDFQRMIVETIAQYFILKNFSVNLYTRYITNQKPIKDETIIGLSTKYEL